MASVSFSRPLWHPDRVFNVFPNDPQSTCVGIASSTGRRCRWPLYSDEQFSASRRAAAVELLRSMSEMHPSEITRAQLYSLAQNTLCRDFHLQKQADRTEFEWTAILDRYVIEHGEMISVRQQLAALQPNARTQDDSQNTKVEYVKAQMEVGCANCEKYEATSSKEVKAQLDIMTTTEITRLETMIRETNEKLDESAKISKEKADDLRQLLVDRHFLQSREQDKKFEQLANAIGGVGQKMTQEMDWVKQELREQVEGLKQEHTKQTNGVKQELRKEIDGLKQEQAKQMDGVKQELRKEIDGLKQELTKREVGRPVKVNIGGSS